MKRQHVIKSEEKQAAPAQKRQKLNLEGDYARMHTRIMTSVEKCEQTEVKINKLMMGLVEKMQKMIHSTDEDDAENDDYEFDEEIELEQEQFEQEESEFESDQNHKIIE